MLSQGGNSGPGSLFYAKNQWWIEKGFHVSDAAEDRQEQNLLELIPARNLEFERTDDGKITIIQPKFTNKFMVKYLLPQNVN